MRRLARRLFTLCSALSLALCVAVCVLWVRSYRVGETFHHWDPFEGREYALFSTMGGVSAYRVRFTPRPYLGAAVKTQHARSPKPFDLDGRVAALKAGGAEAYGPVLGMALFLDWPSWSGSYIRGHVPVLAAGDTLRHAAAGLGGAGQSRASSSR